MNTDLPAVLRHPAELVQAGLVPASAQPMLERVAERYALALTRDLAALIDPGEASDPIARQFIPDGAELTPEPCESPDPIGDQAHSPVPGIVHRYPDRVLLKLVQVCAVYCRFCFRREMVGPGKGSKGGTGGGRLSDEAYKAALRYIRAHPEIWEVILSGGDPMMLSPQRLGEVMADLAAIDHVRVIRLHSRLPVADPGRISDELTAALRVKGATTWLALHANHARELTVQAREACARIIDAGIPMVSQSVLLRGVNDNIAALSELMRAFIECRIKPYYLHHGDLAPGTAHLRTTLALGQELMRALRGRVSGLCQVDYVLDIPGGAGKSPVGPGYIEGEPVEPTSELNSCEPTAETRYRVRSYCGEIHLYPPRT